MELWIGEGKRPVVRVHSKVLDTVMNYISSKEPKVPYEYKKLFLDSGAFTIARRKMTIDKERIKETQEKLDPDKAVPLDYPFQPGQPLKLMEKLWEMTKLNIIEWQETTKLREIVPVVHSWNYSSLRKNILWIHKHIDAKYVALGVIVTPNFVSYKGYFADRQPNLAYIKLISHAIKLIKSLTDFKIHLMGFGSSPLTLHLAYYMGADSTDSTGYRRKAAYGKIVLPGMGERYVGRGDANFGVKTLSLEDRRLLEECGCPVCRVDKGLLWKSWVARAIHNKYVLEMEALKAKQLMEDGLEEYEKYLEKVYSRSSTNFQAYWKYLKKDIRQTILDMFI